MSHEITGKIEATEFNLNYCIVVVVVVIVVAVRLLQVLFSAFSFLLLVILPPFPCVVVNKLISSVQFVFVV